MPAPAPTPAPGDTVTLASPTVMEDGTSMGTANPAWGEGDTSTGGQGQIVDGFSCTGANSNYSYAHLSIYQNGKLLSLPANIGVVSSTYTSQKGCLYPALTRDTSGKIHLSTGTLVTLGQFFGFWGQPLSRSNVAGLADQPIKIYTNDSGNFQEYTGDPAALQLLPHREITIVAGSSVNPIPTYSWRNPPPLSASSTMIWNVPQIGADYWPDGDTASGGHGEPTSSGVACEPSMSDNYHVHVHVAIIKDGQQLAIPQYIGITGSCYYDLHTHDKSGVIHTEAPSFRQFKLGDAFSVWGQPLSKTDVAGFTGEPIKVFINEGGDVWEYQGDPASIDMVSHRSITLQIGSSIAEIPSYSWGGNAQ